MIFLAVVSQYFFSILSPGGPRQSHPEKGVAPRIESISIVKDHHDPVLSEE